MKAQKLKVEQFSQNDIIIALMGPTGSGKSTFINCVAGQSVRIVGHDLVSCTADIEAVRVAHPAAPGSIVFVDTPGFDDTFKSDTEILRMLANWLEETYKNKIKLTGIIYLHPITVNRIFGSPAKNIRLFAKLCGSDAMRNVIFTTTFWDNVDKEIGSRRQKDLVDNHWKPLLVLGSRVDRFDGTFEDAWRIVGYLGNQQSDALLLQEELVDLGKRLSETQAGMHLYFTLQKSLAEQEEVIRKLRDVASKRGDPRLMQELQLEYNQIRETLSENLRLVQRNKMPIMSRIRLWFVLKLAKAVSVPSPTCLSAKWIAAYC